MNVRAVRQSALTTALMSIRVPRVVPPRPAHLAADVEVEEVEAVEQRGGLQLLHQRHDLARPQPKLGARAARRAPVPCARQPGRMTH